MPEPKKLRSVLAEKGMTQRQLAELVSTHETYISAMCNKHVNVREDMLIRLSNALGCKVDDLI